MGICNKIKGYINSLAQLKDYTLYGDIPKSVAIEPTAQTSLETIAKDTGTNRRIRKKIAHPKPINGVSYSTQEVLDMYVEHFIETHRGMEGAGKNLTRFFNAGAGQVDSNYHNYKEPTYSVKVAKVLSIPRKDMEKSRNSGSKTVRDADSFLKNHYAGLKVGMKEEDFESILNPEDLLTRNKFE